MASRFDSPDTADEVFVTEDDRRLGYARYGRRGGAPAFYFHGLPGSRREGVLLHEACRQAGVELIAVDRPGYGLSDPMPGDRLSEWPGRIQRLADHLRVGEFFLFGISGGGPYALACASALSARVRATGICCGLGDVTEPRLRTAMGGLPRLGFLLAQQHPLLLRSSYGLAAVLAARCCAGLTVDVMGWLNSKPDRAALRDPAVRAVFAATLREAMRQGATGGCEDLRAAVRGWPFDLSAVTRLRLWHGDRDGVVPLTHSRWLAGRISAARLEVVAGEGHFSLPVRYASDIVQAVVREGAEGA